MQDIHDTCNNVRCGYIFIEAGSSITTISQHEVDVVHCKWSRPYGPQLTRLVKSITSAYKLETSTSPFCTSTKRV